MLSSTMFLTAIVVILIVVLLAVFKNPTNIYTYFKTKEGLGVLKGIVMFIGIGVIAVFLTTKCQADELKYFQYSSIYLGLESTNKLSPMCKQDTGPNDRLTSNGGVKFNIAQSTDNLFDSYFLYHHGSCAFSEDDKSYDSFGVMVEYRWFSR